MTNRKALSVIWFNIECGIKEIRKAADSVEYCNLCEEGKRLTKRHLEKALDLLFEASDIVCPYDE